jgi:NADPH:quinone reductase-like Zn-dependent oxidoreductase
MSGFDEAHQGGIMKALVYDEYGTPDVLHLRDVPTPKPSDGDVLVKVHATSINDFDWHLLTGRPFLNRIGALRRPKYHVLGSDVAGTVEAVGRSVTRFRPGDEVYGDMSPHGFGAFAEYVCAPAAALAHKPARLTFVQAGTVPQAGSLAMTGLRRRLPLRPDHSILINGAGGGVGTFAVQLAKLSGAHVTAVDAGWKLDALRGLGVDEVIDYEQQDFTENGQAYDLIVDIASQHSMSTYRRSLRPGGMCALTGGSIPGLLLVMAVGPAASSFGSKDVRVPFWKPNDPEEVAVLSGLLDDGSVAPVVDRVMELAEVPDAFRVFAAQQHKGKIAITV